MVACCRGGILLLSVQLSVGAGGGWRVVGGTFRVPADEAGIVALFGGGAFLRGGLVGLRRRRTGGSYGREGGGHGGARVRWWLGGGGDVAGGGVRADARDT